MTTFRPVDNVVDNLTVDGIARLPKEELTRAIAVRLGMRVAPAWFDDQRDETHYAVCAPDGCEIGRTETSEAAAWKHAPAWVDSVDTALALLNGWYYILTRDRSTDGGAVCYIWRPDHPIYTPLHEGRGDSASLAICRAWLAAQLREEAREAACKRS